MVSILPSWSTSGREIVGDVLDRRCRSCAEVWDAIPREIRLLAAAKSQSVAALRAAVAAGVTLIGENYVQEAADKRKKIFPTRSSGI